MTTRFKTDLARMAEEVNDADLADRARSGSRRRHTRRLVAGCALLLVALPLAVVGALRLAPDDSAPPAAELDGSFLYLRDDTESGGRAELVRWNGSVGETVVSIDAEGFANLTVSPDGKRAAWQQTGGSDIDVMVADLSDGKPRKLLSHPADACAEPAWAPTGDRLLTADPAGGLRWTDAGSGDAAGHLETATEVSTQLCSVHPAARSKQRFDVYYAAAEPFRLRYLGPNGAIRDADSTTAIRGSGDWDGVSAIDPHGERLCLTSSTSSDDDLRYPRCDAIVDTGTGRLLRDFRDGPVTQVLFLADGRTISRDADGALELRDAEQRTEATAGEDPRWSNARLLAYLPE